MKTKSILFSVLAVLAVTLTSCWDIPAPEQVFDEADLLGVWCPASDFDTVPVVFVRFTNETDSTGEYKYGREWDESDDIYEEDLTPYGNGWFKYKLDTPNKLTEIHLMDNGGAELPKIYDVLKLTEYELQYKDQYGKTHYWSKSGRK